MIDFSSICGLTNREEDSIRIEFLIRDMIYLSDLRIAYTLASQMP